MDNALYSTEPDPVGGKPHELFSFFRPDGWYSDDPVDVFVKDIRRDLVADLLQDVLPKEAKRMREYIYGRNTVTIRCCQFRVCIQFLSTPKTYLLNYSRHHAIDNNARTAC